MANNAFSLNPGFVGRLAEMYCDHQAFTDEVFKEYAMRSPDGRRRHDTPKQVSKQRIKRDIRELLEVSFWASLTQEEGRQHRFALIYSPTPKAESAPNQPFLFSEALTFDVITLAKLAPAIPSTDVIGVCSRSNNRHSELVIWGFAPLLVGYSLMLKAIKPGQIILSISDWVRAKVTGWDADFVKDYQVLDDLFGKVRSHVRQGGNFLVEAHRRSDLARIALAMLAHRHGGSLLIVPNDEELQDSVEMRFDVSRFEGFKYGFDSRDSAVGNVEKGRLDERLDLDELLKRAQRSSESIGQLTAIDGATVVTYDLTLLGFGAKIKPKKKELKPDTYVLISKPFERSQESEPKHIYETSWGTRHKSAAQFVFDHRNALAIIASQDGRLSLFKWDASKKRISVTEDAEFLLL